MDLFPDIFAARRAVSTSVATSTTTATPATYTYGTVGTYVIAYAGSTVVPGDTVAGSSLSRATSPVVLNSTLGANSNVYAGIAITSTTLSLSGTWRAMTYVSSTYLGFFVRIA